MFLYPQRPRHINVRHDIGIMGVDMEKRDAAKEDEKTVRGDVESRSVLYDSDESTIGKYDVLSREETDPALNAKMHLVNNVSWSFLYDSWQTR